MCVGYKFLLGTSVLYPIQVCVGYECSGISQAYSGIQVCVRFKCVSYASVLEYKCESGTRVCVCWMQVCVGYMCVGGVQVPYL